ncbi:MAG: helix-turn-helix domain-containing protein [Sporichthyaceae bacterium]
MILVLDGQIAEHLVAAIVDHDRLERRRGRRLPRELVELHRALTAGPRVSAVSGQDLPTETPARDDEPLTASQAAQRLGVAERTLRRWAVARKITPIRNGRVVRYRLADVEALSERRN